MFRLRHDGTLCEGWSTEGHRHRKGGWKGASARARTWLGRKTARREGCRQGEAATRSGVQCSRCGSVGHTGVWMRTVMVSEQRGEHDTFYFNLCTKNTCRAYVFLMLILSPCLSQPVVTVVQGTATLSRTCVAQAHGLCLAQNRHTSSRSVIRYTSPEHCTPTGHAHSFLIFDTIFLTSTYQPASTLRRSTTSSEWRCG